MLPGVLDGGASRWVSASLRSLCALPTFGCLWYPSRCEPFAGGSLPRPKANKPGAQFVLCELLHCIAERVPLCFSHPSTRAREYQSAVIERPVPGEQEERLATSGAFLIVRY